MIKEVNENLYDVSNTYCGVVVPRDVMNKIMKILTQAEKEIKDILYDNQDREYLQSWGLAYPNDEQIHFYYQNWNPYSTVTDRIEQLKLWKPEKIKHFYLLDEEKDLQELKDKITKGELYGK